MKISWVHWLVLFSISVGSGGLPAMAFSQEPLPAVVLAEPLAAPDAATVKDENAGQEVELVKERYPSGKIKIERELVQDAEGSFIPHGMWRQFDEQGKLIFEGKFEQSRREGLWRRTYRKGEARLLLTKPYQDFAVPFTSQATFSKGLLQGKWTILDAQERKISEIEFSDGQRDGKAQWYFPNGAPLSQASYHKGLINGDAIEWDASGNVVTQATFVNGHKSGTRLEYHAGGKIKKSEAAYRYAPIVMKTPDDWATCTLATFESRGTDKKHGAFTAWHSNGQVAKQGEFRDNLPVGKVAYFFTNGQTEMEGAYIDGKQDGLWTWWHENGQRAIAGSYVNAKAVGDWSWWKDTGKIAQRTNLSKGQQPQKLAAPNLPSSTPRAAGLPAAEPARLR